MKVKAPIGINDFREVIEQKYLYVDKTLLVEEVWEKSSLVQYITRPGRFGKTLNISMLRYFFDCRQENSSALFRGLAIERRPCFELQGSYPVIYMTFKDLKAENPNDFFKLFGQLMSSLYHQYMYLVNDLDEIDHDFFMIITKRQAGETELAISLARLMEFLEKYHKRRVILLLDDYDFPIHDGYANNYAEEVAGIMRPFLVMALKGNTSLEKAVLTGILRLTNESIFSDLNNLHVFTVFDKPFADKFGFTDCEVAGILKKAECGDQLSQVNQWYNGYQMYEATVFNPWSILNHLANQKEMLRPDYININVPLRNLILKAPVYIYSQLRHLIQGETIESRIEQHIVLDYLLKSEITFWSFLLYNGYLTVSRREWRDNNFYYHLTIPNAEIKQIFETIITEWLDANVSKSWGSAILSVPGNDNFIDLEDLVREL